MCLNVSNKAKEIFFKTQAFNNNKIIIIIINYDNDNNNDNENDNDNDDNNNNGLNQQFH